MKSKALITLVVAAAALAAAAYLVSSGRSAPSTDTAPVSGAGGAQRLFPSLRDAADQIALVEVASAGDKVVSIARTADAKTWVMPAMGEYPADDAKVRTLVRSIIDAEIVEKKTASSDLYSKIGVEDPSAKDAATQQVSLKDSSGTLLAGLIVGKKQEAANYDAAKAATFVRPVGQAQSYLVRGGFQIGKENIDWVTRNVLTMDLNRFSAVVIQQPSGDVGAPGAILTITRPDKEKDDVVVGEKPLDRKLKDEFTPKRVLQTMASLSFDDVRKFSDVDFSNCVTSTFTTFEHLTFTVRSVAHEGKYWVHVAVSYAQPGSIDASLTDEARQIEEVRRAGLQKEAEDLHAKLSPWAFNLTEFTAQQFRSTLDELLAPPEPAATEQQAQPQDQPSLLIPDAPPAAAPR